MRISRTIAPLTLVAYLLATLGVIGTHEHHHGPVSAQSVATADSSAHSHVHQHGSHTHAHSHGSHSHHHHAPDDATSTTSQQTCPGCPSHGPLEDDDCAVCKMLSGKLLTPAPVTLIGLAEQVAELELQVLSPPAAPFDGLPLSRGPPARG